MDEFYNLDRDIENCPRGWRNLMESETPERIRLPMQWNNIPALQRLCIFRALRPDRLTHALRLYVAEQMGSFYVDNSSVELTQFLSEMTPTTPLCFILSPGVNPLLEVEQLARKLGKTDENGLLTVIGLGQGQETKAEVVLHKAAQYGHWVILQVDICIVFCIAFQVICQLNCFL